MNNIIKLNPSKIKTRVLYGRYDRTKIETIGMLGYAIQVYHYLMQWITSENPPEKMILNNKLYFYVSKQKIADDCGLSEKMVRMALDKLAGVPPTILRPFISKYYDSQAHKLWISIEEIPAKWVLAIIPCNRERFEWIDNNISQRYVNVCIESYNKNEEVDVPALFEIEYDNVNANAKMIVDNVIIANSDIFRTKIANTKTYMNCCKIVQDLYNGFFLNPRIYNLSGVENCKWFNTDSWKDKINDVKGDYEKVESLIMNSVSNYRLMFDKRYMPFRKDCLPDSFEKWLYDGMNENYASYLIFSLNKPNLNGKQLIENKSDKIYASMSDELRDIVDKICDVSVIGNRFLFLENIKSMYGWCCWLCNESDINDNLDYWISSPIEIITKFVDYCNTKLITMNEYTFNVKNAFDNNTPFSWFVTEAMSMHNLNKDILKSCA